MWKIDLLKNNKQCVNFPILNSHVSTQSVKLTLQETNESVICSHFDVLISYVEKYFPENMDV